MNRHFRDAVYYLKRAGTTVKQGVVVELEPILSNVRSVTGNESDPEAGRVDGIRGRLESVQTNAEREGRKVVDEAREAVGQYRGT